MGFYEEAGLKVNILPFSIGESDVVDMVLSGQADYGVNYSSLLADFYDGTDICVGILRYVL